MDIQAMVDGMSERWQRERAESQMTLGALISALEAMPPDSTVPNIREPQSYRGYYRDLAFVLREGTRPASELLSDCEEAMGRSFTGYKGGEYIMGERTPVWIAEYGCTGDKLVSISADGIETKPDND